jgi:hypothetical protein
VLTRRLLVLLLLVPPLFAAGASAASLGGLGSASLGAGDAVIPRCDDAITATLVVTETTITAVTVSDLAPACLGGQLSLVVTADGQDLTRGGPVLVNGSSATVPVTPASGLDATDVRVVVVGP